MNIIRQAYAASIYKIVVLSSFITTVTNPKELSDGSRLITDKGMYRHIHFIIHLIFFFCKTGER